MLFNLYFTNNIVLPCFFFFFLIIDVYFLFPAGIAQIINPIAKLVILIGIPCKEAQAEIQIHPVTPEAKIRKCSIQFRVVQTF